MKRSKDTPHLDTLQLTSTNVYRSPYVDMGRKSEEAAILEDSLKNKGLNLKLNPPASAEGQDLLPSSSLENLRRFLNPSMPFLTITTFLTASLFVADMIPKVTEPNHLVEQTQSMLADQIVIVCPSESKGSCLSSAVFPSEVEPPEAPSAGSSLGFHSSHLSSAMPYNSSNFEQKPRGPGSLGNIGPSSFIDSFSVSSQSSFIALSLLIGCFSAYLLLRSASKPRASVPRVRKYRIRPAIPVKPPRTVCATLRQKAVQAIHPPLPPQKYFAALEPRKTLVADMSAVLEEGATFTRPQVYQEANSRTKQSRSPSPALTVTPSSDPVTSRMKLDALWHDTVQAMCTPPSHNQASAFQPLKTMTADTISVYKESATCAPLQRRHEIKPEKVQGQSLSPAPTTTPSKESKTQSSIPPSIDTKSNMTSRVPPLNDPVTSRIKLDMIWHNTVQVLGVPSSQNQAPASQAVKTVTANTSLVFEDSETYAALQTGQEVNLGKPQSMLLSPAPTVTPSRQSRTQSSISPSSERVTRSMTRAQSVTSVPAVTSMAAFEESATSSPLRLNQEANPKNPQSRSPSPASMVTPSRRPKTQSSISPSSDRVTRSMTRAQSVTPVLAKMSMAASEGTCSASKKKVIRPVQGALSRCAAPAKSLANPPAPEKNRRTSLKSTSPKHAHQFHFVYVHGERQIGSASIR